MIGDIYYLGKGVKKDKSKAFAWFLKAAEQGNAEAQRMVGHLYFKGIGVEKDIDEAFAWTLKAAEQGNADAQADLEEYSKAAKGGDGNAPPSSSRNTKPGKPVKNRLNSGETTVNDSCKENANDGQLIPAKEAQGNNMWETVLNLALSALSNISADKINDPVFMRKSLGKAYSLLPFYAKIVISEEVFFNFCFDRRSFLIEKLSSGNKVITQSERLGILPSENEQPTISRETIIINIVDEYSGKMFAEERLYFFPGLDLEKFKNAFDSYIQVAMEKSGIFSKEKGLIAGALKATGITKDALPEALGIPLVLYDVTAFGSCKDGFLLTSKFFITKRIMLKPLIIKLSHIESIDLKKSFLSAGEIVVNGNALIDCVQGKKESLQSFMEMFDEILSVDAT